MVNEHRANRARGCVNRGRSDQRWTVRRQIRTFGNDFPVADDTQQLRHVASQAEGGIPRIDEMDKIAATPVVVIVVVILRAVVVMRRITRGGNIVIMARMIMRMRMPVAVRLMRAARPCTILQAGDDQQNDQKLATKVAQSGGNLVSRALPASSVVGFFIPCSISRVVVSKGLPETRACGWSCRNASSFGHQGSCGETRGEAEDVAEHVGVAACLAPAEPA
jgi:hypothetical protein